MNNTLAQREETIAPKTAAETSKYATFKLSGYLFALSSLEILKIVPTPTPHQGGMVSMGLVQLEQYSIQVLDFSALLTATGDAQQQPAKTRLKSSLMPSTTDLEAPSNNPPFLIVLQDAAELWGIAVNEPPDLMDIPHYALKQLPPEKRLTKTLRWVSHVVTYDLEDRRHTLLVLDLPVLIAAQRPEPVLSTSGQPDTD